MSRAMSANTTAEARAQEATLTARMTIVKIICGEWPGEEDCVIVEIL